MDIWRALLFPLLIAVLLPFVFSFFDIFKVRDEKKISSQEVIRTRPPKTFSGLFLGFALVMLLGGTATIIYCSITDSENTTTTVIIIASVCIVAFSTFGFFSYAFVRFNYVISDTKGIYAYRLFRKKRFYRYEEIGYFKDTISLGIMGGLKGYDKNGAKIFAIEAIHIGASAVAQRDRKSVV